jgi:hypothetical protein
MHSQYYEQSVEAGRRYQESEKVWAGLDSKKYARPIRDLVQYYQARTMLDYGCGKGLQYQNAVSWPTDEVDVFTEAMTFDQYIGAESYYLYDPCVASHDIPPHADDEFDFVVCTQVLGSIPDDDLWWVVDNLMSWTRKFCFIGLIEPAQATAKSRKRAIYDQQYWTADRTKQWYLNKLSRWEGSDLYLYFKGEEMYRPGWYVNQAIRQDKE